MAISDLNSVQDDHLKSEIRNLRWRISILEPVSDLDIPDDDVAFAAGRDGHPIGGEGDATEPAHLPVVTGIAGEVALRSGQ